MQYYLYDVRVKPSIFIKYRIFSNKRRALNKRRTFGYLHWNKRLPLISASPLNVVLIRIVTIFYK